VPHPLRTLFRLLPFALLTFASPAWASGPLPVELELAVGALFPGEALVDFSPPSFYAHNQTALIWGGGVDVPVLPGWYVSGRALTGHASLADRDRLLAWVAPSYREQVPTWVSGLQVELGPKVALPVGGGLELTFALYGGYRMLWGDTDLAASRGFAFDGAAQLHIPLAWGVSQFWELGFLTEPYGGREGDYYLSFGPILYLLAGLHY
jgi:hypothetical protein